MMPSVTMIFSIEIMSILKEIKYHLKQSDHKQKSYPYSTLPLTYPTPYPTLPYPTPYPNLSYPLPYPTLPRTLPYPTLYPTPYPTIPPTLPYSTPNLPYPALPYPTPYPTLPYPTLPLLHILPYPTLSYPTLPPTPYPTLNRVHKYVFKPRSVLFDVRFGIFLCHFRLILVRFAPIPSVLVRFGKL